MMQLCDPITILLFLLLVIIFTTFLTVIVAKYNVVAIDNVIYSIQILLDDILMIITDILLKYLE